MSSPDVVSAADIAAMPSLDEGAAAILRQVSAWVSGVAYHAYWLTADGSDLELVASLTSSLRTRVAPDYSGLVSQYGPSLPFVPLIVPSRSVPEQARFLGDGGLCRLDLPFGPELLAVVLIRPPIYVSTRLLARLVAASHDYRPAVTALHRRFRSALREVAEQCPAV